MNSKTNNAHHDLDDAKVGDGATHTIYSDSHAGTIIKRTATTIWWQRDNATLLNGMNSDAEDKLTCSVGGFAGHVEGRQRYEYERDENAPIVKFTRRVIKIKRHSSTLSYETRVRALEAQGATRSDAQAVIDAEDMRPTERIVWKRVGSNTRSPGNTLNAGRREHYDYNF